MINKTIHYCWFGRKPKPKLAEKCIKSWKKYCPDYEIIEWNEDNFDLAATPLYVRQAYEAKKWAFVTDYVRLRVVYDHGGIYMDTDVELLKNLDFLLDNNAYFGFENGEYVATGLGFGAIQGCKILKEMMLDYEHIPFILPDGTYDKITCPRRNTEIFLRHGLKQNDTRQVLDGNILVLPSVYMCPVSYTDGKNRKTRESISIHWFSASWKTHEEQKQYQAVRQERLKIRRKVKILNCTHNILHIPNRVLCGILGNERYEQLKRWLKK